jgi:hypothetical protein
MLVQVWVRPVACPHSQQKACPQRHSTRLHLHRGKTARGGEGGWGGGGAQQGGGSSGPAKLCACEMHSNMVECTAA